MDTIVPLRWLRLAKRAAGDGVAGAAARQCKAPRDTATNLTRPIHPTLTQRMSLSLSLSLPANGYQISDLVEIGQSGRRGLPRGGGARSLVRAPKSDRATPIQPPHTHQPTNLKPHTQHTSKQNKQRTETSRLVKGGGGGCVACRVWRSWGQGPKSGGRGVLLLPR